MVNAATFLADSLAPGQLVSIFGSRLGPRDPAYFTLDPANPQLPTSLAGTEITFDGIPAPLVWTGREHLCKFAIRPRVSSPSMARKPPP